MKKILLPLLLALSTLPGYALINVRFTPVQLAASAEAIVQVELTPLKDNSASAKITRTLKGKFSAESISLDLTDTDDTERGDFAAGGTVGLLFTGDFSKASSAGDGSGNKPSAMLQVGTHWFALFEKDGKWRVDSDPLDLSAVWGGSAAALAECVKYCLADPRADVPAQVGTKFVSDEKLGNVPGKVSGIKIVGSGSVVIQSDAGDVQWEFPGKTSAKLTTATKKEAEIIELNTDYDGDGLLDKLEVKPDGPRLSRNAGGGKFVDASENSAELDYHSRSKPAISYAADCDVNCDGRPDVLLAYGSGPPLVFFNRGFGSFGLARDLLIQDSELKGAPVISAGQQAATFVDVNGDGSPDLLAVVANGDIWVLYTKLDRPSGPSVTVVATEPLVVTAREGVRSLGARQVIPGIPVVFWLKNPGPLDLEWGDGHKKRVIALKPVRVDLSAEK